MKKAFFCMISVSMILFACSTMPVKADTIYKTTSKYVYLKNGKLYDKGTLAPIMSKVVLFNGVTYRYAKRANGLLNGMYYKNGYVYTGVADHIYYVKGKKTTAIYRGNFYYKGPLNKKVRMYNGKLYNGAKVNKGYIVFSKRLYKNTTYATGYYVYNNVLYKNSYRNNTVYQYKGSWYRGSVIQSGWLRTKQLGWIKVDDQGKQIKDAIPPAELGTPSLSTTENPENTASNEMSPFPSMPDVGADGSNTTSTMEPGQLPSTSMEPSHSSPSNSEPGTSAQPTLDAGSTTINDTMDFS